MTDINKVVERLRTRVSIAFDNRNDDQQDYDILDICDYVEKSSKVVEAARRAVGQCCNHAGLEQALAAMEEQ